MPDILVIHEADRRTLDGFDAVIDVRSPSEFAEDHIAGAVNLPVLEDAERAEVGTIYVQDSRFRARRIGAALIAKNVAHHLQTSLADKPAAFRPLIHCWRGGMRSGAMATILSQIGWRTAVLAGGYKTYRRHVRARLYESDERLNVVLLAGPTGSGKTEVLQRLAAHDAQTIDLEGLAEHRGSLFGAVGAAQPSQKLFESRLLAALDQVDASRPIVVEAESSKIGDRMIAPVLWRAMLAAPRIALNAPAEARARYLVAAYGEITGDHARLDDVLARLPWQPGKKALEKWRALAGAGAFEALAAELIETHYDPAYARGSKRDARPQLGIVEMKDLSAAALDLAAERVAKMASLAPRGGGGCGEAAGGGP